MPYSDDDPERKGRSAKQNSGSPPGGGGSKNPRKERRERTRSDRGRRYGRGQTHKTAICPDCRRETPYLHPVQSIPGRCGYDDCRYLFACPECGSDIRDRDEDAVYCPACSEPLSEDAPAPEETFTWDS